EQLTQRGLLLAVSEQFTAGLLHWQLQSAAAPLAGGELLPAHCQESLAEVAGRAQSLSMLCGAQVVLAVSAMQNDCLSVALHTPEGTFAQTVRYQASRHGLRIRQESSAMLALDMLRRWLKGSPICGQHGWLNVVDILSLN
ncbi:competence/damage-inducible protein A, partial [Yersinia enterocolitica]|nr:competence/damage-inducible protein A [Yersinia enterocolitica]